MALAHEFENEVIVAVFVLMFLWLVEIFDISDGCFVDTVCLDRWADFALLKDFAVIETEVASFEGHADAVVGAESFDVWGSGVDVSGFLAIIL